MNVNAAATGGGDRDRALPGPPRVPWTARPGLVAAVLMLLLTLAAVLRQSGRRSFEAARIDARLAYVPSAGAFRAVTTLDPRFDAAYRFGAIFLAEPYPDGAGRPDPAVKLLKKGVRARPERWQYPPSVEPGAAARR